MKNNKKGFTIAELILTTVIIAVVLIVAPIIVLKRNVKPAVAKKFDFIAQCKKLNDDCSYPVKCIFDASATTIKTYCNGKLKSTSDGFDYNKGSNEFYTIELVGGGSGGTNKSIGFPGSSKTIFLPSLDRNIDITNNKFNDDKYKGILTGYYLMEIGEGGTIASSGGNTQICIIDKNEAEQDNISSLNCTGKIIIAAAQGGITSNFPDGICNDSSLSDDERNRKAENESKAKVVSDSTGSNDWGSGAAGTCTTTTGTYDYNDNQKSSGGTIVIK